MTRRNTELLLLCLAAPIVILLYAMIVMNQGQPLGINTLGVPIAIFVGFAIAHIAVRKFAPGADPAILPLSFALSGIGIAFITRLAPDMAVRQVEWLFISIACMIAVMALIKDPDHVANYKYTLMLFGLLLLLSPMLPGIGRTISGSRIWLAVGSFSFQPGEIAKIFIVLFLAGYFAENREMLSIFTMHVGPFRLPDARTIMPMMLMWVLSLIIVIFERDLGSALVVFFVFIFMLYVASGKKSYVFIGLGLAAVGAVAMYNIFGHVQVRVSTWLNPFADASGTGYQLCQAIYSMADGDLFGVGIGKGMCDQIPVVESDYIFAAIAEESGLLGAAAVLLMYLLFAVRGYVTAARAKSDVSSFIATGLTTSLVLQAFIIVGGVTRLIPLTGLTMPFVSQGGSSLLASFISVGFLLKCGDEGTGVGAEIDTASNSTGVLGRVSLGKRITHVMIIMSVLFAALVANLTLLMIVNANHYQNLPTNNHTIQREAKKQRGTISTADGTVLAESDPNGDGTYTRVYPAGDLATHVVGYYSSRYGASGIESAENETLTGNENFASWSDVLNYYAGLSTQGNDVQLTINSKVQKAAQDALDGFDGACVVMDPQTGAILGMASSPTYDANNFDDVLSNENSGDNSDALFNRATQALYAPGSTFKMVTLGTALENDVANESTTYNAPGSIDIGGANVYNFDRNNYGVLTLTRATALSANTAFGQLGVQEGSSMLVNQATKFGFNQNVPFDLPLAESLMPDPSEMTEWETAWAACGQPVGQHDSPAGPQATVLQMALVGSAIANDGVEETPYVVQSTYNSNGQRASQTSPTPFATVLSSDTAQRERKVLEQVVENGTGTAAQIPGITIAGKTGTAETGKPIDNSWFVGIGPSDNSKVVVAIVLEQGAANDSEAPMRARSVMETALQEQGAM